MPQVNSVPISVRVIYQLLNHPKSQHQWCISKKYSEFQQELQALPSILNIPWMKNLWSTPTDQPPPIFFAKIHAGIMIGATTQYMRAKTNTMLIFVTWKRSPSLSFVSSWKHHVWILQLHPFPLSNFFPKISWNSTCRLPSFLISMASEILILPVASTSIKQQGTKSQPITFTYIRWKKVFLIPGKSKTPHSDHPWHPKIPSSEAK